MWLAGTSPGFYVPDAMYRSSMFSALPSFTGLNFIELMGVVDRFLSPHPSLVCSVSIPLEPAENNSNTLFR